MLADMCVAARRYHLAGILFGVCEVAEPKVAEAAQRTKADARDEFAALGGGIDQLVQQRAGAFELIAVGQRAHQRLQQGTAE